MTVLVRQLPQPYMELSLVAGGSLTVGQEYFFIQYFNNGQGYYGNAVSPGSTQKSIIPTTGNQSIKIDWWVYNQEITAFAMADATHTTVTSAGHGQSNGDTVHIGETSNYNGDYTISNVTVDTFDITKIFVGTETGILAWKDWLPNYSNRYQGTIWKWDKYSMLRPDGSFYQWFNLNDPVVNAFTGGDEYYYSYAKRYGHRKWTTRYYHQGFTGTTITFTKEETSTGYNKLLDGDVVGSTVAGQMRHPQLAYNPVKYPTPYATGEFNIDKGRLLITSDADNATTDNLIDALQASGHDDMYFISNDYTYASAMKGVVIAGHFQQPTSGGYKFKDLNLTLIGGQLDHGTPASVQGFNFERSTVLSVGSQYASWITERANYIDSVRNHIGNAYIMDYVSAVNSSFQGYMTFYKKVISGFNMIGGYPGANVYFQWRYQRKSGVVSSMTDFYIKNYYIYFTQDGYGDNTGYMTRVKFENKDFTGGAYDVYIAWNYVDGDCNYIMECVGVTSNRDNGQIIVYSNSNTSRTITDIWNFRYKIDLTVIDKDGILIEGVDCVLDWGTGTNSNTTDATGKTNVVGLGYTSEKQHTTGSAEYVNSDWNTMTLTISKAGYTSIIYTDILLKEDKDWEVVLTKGGGSINKSFSKRIKL